MPLTPPVDEQDGKENTAALPPRPSLALRIFRPRKAAEMHAARQAAEHKSEEKPELVSRTIPGERRTSELILEPVFGFDRQLDRLRGLGRGSNPRDHKSYDLAMQALELAREQTKLALNNLRKEMVRQSASMDKESKGFLKPSGEVKELYGRNPQIASLNTEIALLKVGIENRCELTLDGSNLPRVSRFLYPDENTAKQQTALQRLEQRLASEVQTAAVEGARAIRDLMRLPK